MKKRLLTFILALALCAGLLPMGASAAETAGAGGFVERMPDNPGIPVFLDVTQSTFWPQDIYWKYPESIEEVYSQIVNVTNEVVKGKGSETEKAKAIFDWVAQNIKYDYEAYAKGQWSREAETSFYVFYRRMGVCDGYTRLCNLMSVIAGLPTAYILGRESNKLHSWDAVYADGRWIYYDATWNDWDVDPYSYHDAITSINIFGSLQYSLYGSPCEVGVISQKGYVLPKNLVIPDFIDVLNGNAFMFREEVESVFIPKNVKKVDGLFEGCPNLKSVTFEGGPDSRLKFVRGFSRCPSLAELVIPDGVTQIGYFWGCTSLRRVTIPDSVREIEYSTFTGCTSLQEVKLPNGLKEIPCNLFGGCTSLKSVTVPSSVTKIDDVAFARCPALESVYIPGSVTEIEKSMFAGVTPFDESPNVVIYTEPGSYIESYAKEHGIKVVTSGMPTPADSSTPSAWAQAEVSEAAQAGLVPSDLRSAYTSAITRSDFCRLMVALVEANSGKDIASYVSSMGKTMSAPFTDTSAQEVRAAYALGIVNGVSATRFNPSGSITRQEAAAMLERTAKLLGLTSGSGVSFNDSGSIASWATGSVAFVSGLTDPVTGGKVMGGVSGGRFDPLGTYTREQAIATALRLFHCAG